MEEFVFISRKQTTAHRVSDDDLCLVEFPHSEGQPHAGLVDDAVTADFYRAIFRDARKRHTPSRSCYAFSVGLAGCERVSFPPLLGAKNSAKFNS